MAGSRDVLLVCEDTAHKAFVYSCLATLGIEDLKWHVDAYVASLARQGGNRDDVIARLNGTEFAAWKSRCARHKVLLVVVLDADDDPSADVRALLPAPTHYGEMFAVVIPKRDIQTWVELAINGKSSAVPDEQTDYKRAATRSDARAKDAAKTLLSWYQGTVPKAISENAVWKTFASQMEDLQQAIKAWNAI